MASFIELIAERLRQRHQEFLAGLALDPQGSTEARLATGVRALWQPLASLAETAIQADAPAGIPNKSAVAVDGSRATRALNTGAVWVIAQALLLGPGGLRMSAADTMLLRGEIERPAIDRFAALIMRSLELDLALRFAAHSATGGDLLLLDGSLYAELPHLLYPLAVPGYEDLPLVVLRQYLDLFDVCQERDILLLGVAKSARSTVLGRVITDGAVDVHAQASPPTDRARTASPDALEDVPESDDASAGASQVAPDPLTYGLPVDAELLHRWTSGAGLTTLILLGSASFGHRRRPITGDPIALAAEFTGGKLTPAERRGVLQRLRAAPAIGTFYVRLNAGEDALRVDAPASAFGRADQHLLDFTYRVLPHDAALLLVRRLLDDYGGINVYNAALYVVDRETRLHAETVDHVYLSVLRRQLDLPIQYDRSTRRFVR